jgi:hypothetical protein
MGSVKRNLKASLGAAVGSSIVCIGEYCLPHQISTDSLSLLTANCAFRDSVRTVYGGHPGFELIPFHSFIVILGWILGKPLTLLFDPFESIVLFLSGETPTCYRCNPDVG